jgi:hypothetical protein
MHCKLGEIVSDGYDKVSENQIRMEKKIGV